MLSTATRSAMVGGADGDDDEEDADGGGWVLLWRGTAARMAMAASKVSSLFTRTRVPCTRAVQGEDLGAGGVEVRQVGHDGRGQLSGLLGHGGQGLAAIAVCLAVQHDRVSAV
ncbi:hypothetical protein VTK73DRAFT_2734 [Phialemonium thermophilum]|uniref:Uncharacterized protein n=1 Tax=Phialemonium thermophilum TaxID=223376 RepID=A0ABR3VQ17_9PEZI